jgi:hypothetical protein
MTSLLDSVTRSEAEMTLPHISGTMQTSIAKLHDRGMVVPPVRLIVGIRSQGRRLQPQGGYSVLVITASFPEGRTGARRSH